MKVLKLTGKTILYIVLIIIGVWVLQYLFASIYIFPEPSPFKGEKIYNPYKGLDSNNWKKSNFQVQSAAWFGITDGSENSNETIDSIFNYLGFDVIGISDYMKINEYKKNIDPYIPLYEHGYNIWKRHQVCLGADKVNWHDYVFYQSIHHKQDIINRLRDETELIIIAHPNYEGGYKAEDFRYLTNYDGIEILNYFRQSIEHWDTALSVGRYVIGVGNDDVHDIYDPDEVGQYCTYINSNSLNGDSLLSAMKKGKVYAAHIHRDLGETFEEKKKNLADIPEFRYVKLNGDTLWVKTDRPAHVFKFIGQNGAEKKRVSYVDSAFYVFQPEDTYIRTQIHYPNKNVLFLGPLVRYSGDWPIENPSAYADPFRTWVYRIILGASIIFVLLNVVFLRRRIKKKKIVK